MHITDERFQRLGDPDRIVIPASLFHGSCQRRQFWKAVASSGPLQLVGLDPKLVSVAAAVVIWL